MEKGGSFDSTPGSWIAADSQEKTGMRVASQTQARIGKTKVPIRGRSEESRENYFFRSTFHL